MSAIDAKTLEDATRAAEELYSKSTDEQVQLVVGVFLQIMEMPRTEFVAMPSDKDLDNYINSSTCKCPGRCTCPDQ